MKRLVSMIITLAMAMLAHAAALAQSPFATQGEPLDYALLSHRLVIEMLRAGNHDASGTNDYYFTVQMYGLVNTPEERNSSFEKRRKVSLEIGQFGATKLDALSIWRPDEKNKDSAKFMSIDGHQIRELIARTMAEHKVGEPNVAVMVEISMLESEKRFWFFGQDRFVAKTTYYPVPPTLFDSPFRTNVTLSLSDETGTDVRIALVYDKPAAATKADRKASAPSSPRKAADTPSASSSSAASSNP